MPPTVRYVISVLVPDRVGILRDITAAVADMGANIDAISQTVVEGYFTLILTAAFPAGTAADTVRAQILARFRPDEASVIVRPYHAAAAPGAGGERYVFTITGVDRPGILKRTAAFFADKNINVEDWFVGFENTSVTHIGEISVPSRLDIKQLQDEFACLLSAWGLSGSIQHENIFRVTNEVGSVQPLLRGRRA